MGEKTVSLHRKGHYMSKVIHMSQRSIIVHSPFRPIFPTFN